MTIKVLNRKNFFNSDVIKLVYWNEPNFGDILSPYMVEKLSGKKIVYKSYNISGLNIIKKLIKLILVFDFKKISSILFPWEKNLLAIGSILSHGNKHSIVWGSGFISEDESFNGGKILAVRGKYTNDKLIKMGFQGTSIYGDPALLIPILVNPVSCKTDLIGIIPHWSEVDYFLDRYNNKYKIIDFRTREVENTIAQGVSPDGSSLTLNPEFTRKLLDTLNYELEKAISSSGNQPVLLCSSPIRLPFRRLIERTYPQIAVMSYNEISNNVKAKSIGVIRVAPTMV